MYFIQFDTHGPEYMGMRTLTTRYTHSFTLKKFDALLGRNYQILWTGVGLKDQELVSQSILQSV